MVAMDLQPQDHPSVAPRVDVRVVLFTVAGTRLLVAFAGPCRRLALPRGLPMPLESLDAAASRVLAANIGGEERYQEQLYTISQGVGDHWTVSIAYLGLATSIADSPPRVTGSWIDVAALPELETIDANFIEYALLRLRAKLGYTTIAFHLLPECFSMSELQGIYEAVLNRKLDKRNFRRRIHAGRILEPTGEIRRDGSHRPARLYRCRAAHDAEAYLTPAWASTSVREAVAG